MAAPSFGPGGRAMVSVFDGTRKLYSDSGPVLITVIDGNQHTLQRRFFDSAQVQFTELPLQDNFADNYTFVAFADGYKQAGFFPVKLKPGAEQQVDLMLAPATGQFNFANVTWGKLGASSPELKTLVSAGAADDNAAAARYGDLQEKNGGASLACLLNLTAAMKQIFLPEKRVFDYLKEVVFEGGPAGSHPPARDRFYAWADPKLIDQAHIGVQQGIFAPAPAGLHDGATSSVKQISFGEANVQLTFHENDRKDVNGLNCVLVEPDIDYFKDTGAHLLLEVAVNALGSLTDPAAVYVLRWIAGRRAGTPEFDPLYTIEKA